MMRKVTTEPNVQSISDRELLQRMMAAFHRYKDTQRLGDFKTAEKAWKASTIYETEARRRMSLADPVLRGTHG